MDPGITHINKMANHSLDFPQFFKALKFKKKKTKQNTQHFCMDPSYFEGKNVYFKGNTQSLYKEGEK